MKFRYVLSNINTLVSFLAIFIYVLSVFMISSSVASSFLSPLLCASNQVEVGETESCMVCY